MGINNHGPAFLIITSKGKFFIDIINDVSLLSVLCIEQCANVS